MGPGLVPPARFARDRRRDDAREKRADSFARGGGGIARALHLINGDTIQARLRGGIIDRLVAANASDRETIGELYLRALSRSPAANEEVTWTRMLAGSTNRREAIEDLLWTLLNSREFAFNH